MFRSLFLCTISLWIKFSVETDLPDIAVDKDRIVQVLTNLIGNALQNDIQ
jgi:nitrogen-specific signal transduction histidine kinase